MGFGEEAQESMPFGFQLAAVVSDAVEVEDVPGGGTHHLGFERLFRIAPARGSGSHHRIHPIGCYATAAMRD